MLEYDNESLMTANYYSHIAEIYINKIIEISQGDHPDYFYLR